VTAACGHLAHLALILGLARVVGRHHLRCRRTLGFAHGHGCICMMPVQAYGTSVQNQQRAPPRDVVVWGDYGPIDGHLSPGTSAWVACAMLFFRFFLFAGSGTHLRAEAGAAVLFGGRVDTRQAILSSLTLLSKRFAG